MAEVSSRVVTMDSAGVQEESPYLRIRCPTLRENTELPSTVFEGSNRLVKPGRLEEQAQEALAGRWPTGREPALRDGRAARRCVAALQRRAGIHGAIC